MKKLMKLRTMLALAVPLMVAGCNDSDKVDRSEGANLTISKIDANNLHFYEMGDTIKVD